MQLLKIFLISFAILFVTFFVVGYKCGNEEIKQAGFLESYIFSKVTIIPADSSIYLGYQRSDSSWFLYDVDSDTLIKVDPNAIANKNTTVLPKKNLVDNINNTVTAAVGTGGLALFTIKDVILKQRTIVEEVKNGNTMVTVLGGTLGWAIGFQSGYLLSKKRSIPGEQSKQYTDILVDGKNWKNKKGEVYSSIWQNIRAKTAKNNSLRALALGYELRELIQRVKVNSSKILDPGSADFRKLFDLENRVNKLPPLAKS